MLLTRYSSSFASMEGHLSMSTLMFPRHKWPASRLQQRASQRSQHASEWSNLPRRVFNCRAPARQAAAICCVQCASTLHRLRLARGPAGRPHLQYSNSMLLKQQQQHHHHKRLACMGTLAGCARDSSSAQCTTCSVLHATCRQASSTPRLLEAVGRAAAKRQGCRQQCHGVV